MRLLGAILIVVGTAIFIGNITGFYPTVPGLGVGMAVAGGMLLYYLRRADILSTGIDDWRYRE